MQGVSFPDINKTPTLQTVAPPCMNTPIPGIGRGCRSGGSEDDVCLTPPRPVLWCKSSDGTAKNQSCTDEGPLTLERSKTVDEEISAKVVDFLDRNDPKKTNKPFFVWYNPARMHVTTVLVGQVQGHGRHPGGKDWGMQRSRHEADGRQHRPRAQEARGMGQLDNTIVVFTTDNGAETITFPDGGVTPVQGRKARPPGKAACALRASSAGPDKIKPGTVFNDMFASLDWLPTFVEIAGGPKGDGLNKQIMAGTYQGIVKTKLDGVNQLAYLLGKSPKSARDTFFYYRRRLPSAVRYKNWKIYFADGLRRSGGLHCRRRCRITGPRSRTSSAIRSRTSVGSAVQDASWVSAARSPVPSTAYLYDWNMLPIGQLLWLKELETYTDVPAAAGRGELQPRSGHGPGQEADRHPGQ